MADEYQINANITADATGFEAGIDKAVSGSTKLEKSLEQTEKNLSKSFENISKSAAKIGSVLSVGVTLPIVALGKKFLESSGQFQVYQASFETMLASASKATSLIAQLQTMAAKTPFELKDLAGASQTLLQFNVAEEKLIPTLQSLGDIAQGNGDKFRALSLAYGQASSTGRLMGQDLLQMINAGFNPLQEISKKTGESIVDLKDKMSKGQITVEMLQGAFESATAAGGKFFGGMEKASRTLPGLLSTLNDDFMTMGRSFTDALLPPAMELVKTLSNMAKWVTELPEPIKKTITQVLLLAAALGPLALAISAVTAALSVLAAHPIILALAAAAAATIALKTAFGLLSQSAKDTKKATDDLVTAYGNLEDSQQRRIRLAREEMEAIEDSAQRRARLEREAKDAAAAVAKEKADEAKKAAEEAKKLSKEVAETRAKAEKEYQEAMAATSGKLKIGLITYSESIDEQKSATETYITKLLEAGDTNSTQLLAAIRLWQGLTDEINIANEAISNGAKADSDRLAARAKAYQDSKQAMTEYNAIIQANGEIAGKYGHEKIKLDDLSMYTIAQIIDLTKDLQEQVDFQKSEEQRLIEETATEAAGAAEENTLARERAAQVAITESARIQAVDNARLEAASRGYAKVDREAEEAAQKASDRQIKTNNDYSFLSKKRVSDNAEAAERERLANESIAAQYIALSSWKLSQIQATEEKAIAEESERQAKLADDYSTYSNIRIANERDAAQKLATEETDRQAKLANDYSVYSNIRVADEKSAAARTLAIEEDRNAQYVSLSSWKTYQIKTAEEKAAADEADRQASLANDYSSLSNIRVADEKAAAARILQGQTDFNNQYISISEVRIAQEKSAREKAEAEEIARQANLADQYSSYAKIRIANEKDAIIRASLYAQKIESDDLESKKSTLQKAKESIRENLEKELLLVGDNENAKRILIANAEYAIFMLRVENLNKYVSMVGNVFSAIGGKSGEMISKMADTFTKVASAAAAGFENPAADIAALVGLIGLAGEASGEKFEALQKGIEELASRLLTALAPVIELVIDLLAPMIDILIALVPILNLVALAIEKMIRPIVDLITWIVEGGKAIWNWIKGLFGANDATEEAVVVSDEYADALSDVNDELKKNKDLFTQASNSGNAYTTMLTKMRQKVADFYSGLQNIGTDIADKLVENLTSGLTESDFMTTMKKYISNLVIQAAVFTAGMSEKIASIGQMIATSIANGTFSVDMSSIKAQLQALYQSASTAAAAASDVVGAAFSGYATGTRSATAGMHMVAETGPELVVNPSVKYLNQGARVFNAQDTAKVMGGNSTIVNANFNSPKSLSPYEMRKQLRQYNRSLAFNGGMAG